MSDQPAADDFIEPPPAEGGDYTSPSHYDDLVTARSAGYSWPEINNDIGSRYAAAYDAGYTQQEVDDHLGYIEPQGFEQRAQDTWTAAMARQPELLSGLEAPDPTIDLSMSPSLRGDYADALLGGEVKSPDDFALRYAGAALSAAHDIYGLDAGDDDTVKARQLAGSVAADLAAPGLPSVEDMTDATLSVSNADPAAVATARERLMGQWTKDGTPVVQQAIDASVNPWVAAFYQQQAIAPTIAGPLAELAAKFGFGAGEALSTPGAEIAAKLEDASLVEALGAVIGRIPRAFWEAFQGGGETIAAAARGEPVSAEEALNTAMMMASMSRFKSGLPALEGDILPPIPRAPLPELPKPGAPTIEGEVIRPVEGPKVQLPPPPPVPVVDLGAAPGEPMKLIPAREALEPPPAQDAASAAGFAVSLMGQADRMELLRLENEGITPNGMESGGFFQRIAEQMRQAGLPEETIADLPKDIEPKQVVEMAEGYDGARAVYGYFKGMMGDLLSDDSGSWNIRRSPQERALTQQARESRETLRSLILREQGRGEQEIANVAARLSPIYKFVNPHMPEWQAEIAKGPAGDPMGTTIGGLVNYIEGLGYGPVLKLDESTPVASMIRDLNVEKYQMLQDAFNRGDIDAPGYRDNYFRHLWKDPSAASTWFDQHQAMQGTGRQGSTATLKQRTLPTVADGLRAGLEPAIAHPLDLTLYDISSTVKMLHSTRIRKEMENLGLMAFRGKPEPGELPLSGVGVQRAIPLQKPLALRQAEADARTALAADPGNKQLQADVAAATEAAAPGAMLERAYAIPAVAKMYNNWLSLGWHAHPVSSDVYQNLMYAKNTLTGLKLIMPIFHSVVIAEQTLAAGMAEASMHLAAGNIGKAMAEFAKTGFAFPKAIQTYRRGLKARDNYVKMASDPILSQLVDAGLRIGPRQDVYRMGAPAYWHSIAQNNAGNTFMAKFSNVAKAAGRELKREIDTIGGPPGEPIYKTAPLLPFRVAKVPLDELGRAMTTLSAPLFDHLIPVMKAGAATQLFETWLRTHPNASEATVKRRAQQVVEDVDNRLGEMNFDTVFANRWFKQTANAATISASWAFGTWRWTADALGLRGRFNPIATQTLMGAAIVYAGANLLLTTLHTGRVPIDPWDAVNFRTGTYTASGEPKRGLIPTEFKEYFDIGKILATVYGRGDNHFVFQGVKDYLLGKENGFFSIMRAELTGEDAIGHKIAYTPGGWLKFYENQVFPLVLENYTRPKKGTGLSTFERLFIREAPEWITDPASFYGKQGGLANRWTKEELSRAKRENSLLENPDPEIGLPSVKGGGGGSRGGSRGGNRGGGAKHSNPGPMYRWNK